MFQLEGRHGDALEHMRDGIEIAIEDGHRGFRYERIGTYLATAYEEAQAREQDRPTLYAEMFEVAQMRREGTAAQTIAQTALRLAGGTDDKALLLRELLKAERRRDDIRLKLGRQLAKPRSQRNGELVAQLNTAFEAAQVDWQRASSRLEAAAPDIKRLLGSDPVPAERLGSLMRADEALLYVLAGDRDSFIFVVRAGRVTPAPLVVQAPEIAATVRSLRQAFDTSDGSLQVYDMAQAHALYEQVIGPVADKLDGVRHLIVAAGGALLSLPFGLLVTEPSPGVERYAKAQWLARKMAISVVPSVRGFSSLRQLAKPSRAPKPFLGFGNPVFAGGGGMDAMAEHCGGGKAFPAALIRGLAPLPETANEIQHVAESLAAGPESVNLGQAASEAVLRGLPLDQYRTLYFATHGLLPGELRCEAEPALALTPPAVQADDRAADGLLEASEIATLKLDADLVVLSACNTGGGSGRFGGEALSGLTESFFYAGARTLLVSHWQVDSRSTMRMMIDTFHRLSGADGFLLAEAQRQAQLGLLADPATSHPFFWAAFTVIGDGARPGSGS